MGIQLKNNASGTLATAINASDTGIVLTTGNGANFPVLGLGDYFYATLESTGGTFEVIRVTARSGDSMTVLRAQEGSIANSFAAGSRLESRITAQAVIDTATQYAGDADQNLRNDLAAATGSSLVGFQQAGSGTVLRATQAKLRETVSVKDFGAVGDGVTDDTAAVQAAVTYVVGRGGGKIYAPAGKYRISDTIDFYAGSPARVTGVSFEGEAGIAGESGNGAGTIFEWHGANDRPVFKATGNSIRGLKFGGFLLMGAGTYGSPTNPYQDGFWIAPTSLSAAHKVVFDNLWVRDFTRTGWMLGDPTNPSVVDPTSYNGQMANSAMYNCWGAGYLPDAKVIWAKGGTSEDFYIYNLACLSMSGNDKKNFITTEGGFYIDIYGLLTDGLDDDPTYYSIVAKTSVSVYQWITEDLRIYDTVVSNYGHPIVLSGVRMLSSNARHGGTLRDAIRWRGVRNAPAPWDAVPIMSLQGCVLNNNVAITGGANQQQFSAIGVTFANGGFVYSGTNQRVLAHDSVKGALRQSGPDVSYEQFTQDGVSRFLVDKGAIYTRRNTLADITADQNDYALGTTGAYFRFSPVGADRTVTGLADGADGRQIIVRNISGTNNLILANQSASSAAANRIVTTTGSDLTVAPSKTAQLIYDSPTSRWVVISYY